MVSITSRLSDAAGLAPVQWRNLRGDMSYFLAASLPLLMCLWHSHVDCHDQSRAAQGYSHA
jgi:hypothetical protein